MQAGTTPDKKLLTCCQTTPAQSTRLPHDFCQAVCLHVPTQFPRDPQLGSFMEVWLHALICAIVGLSFNTYTEQLTHSDMLGTLLLPSTATCHTAAMCIECNVVYMHIACFFEQATLVHMDSSLQRSMNK